MIRLDFYYFSMQCPLNDPLLGLLGNYKNRIEINTFDFSWDFDVKSVVLKVLEEYLRHHYEKIRIISDEASTFPNRNLSFFLKNGYQNKGAVYEDEHYCRLHLLGKRLS